MDTPLTPSTDSEFMAAVARHALKIEETKARNDMCSVIYSILERNK